MSALVEKVARAIYHGRNGYGCKPWGRQTSAHKAAYRMDAITALKAMNAPTDEMCDVGAVMYCDLLIQDKTGEVAAWHIFTAMIDAAIQEHSTTPPRNAS